MATRELRLGIPFMNIKTSVTPNLVDDVLYTVDVSGGNPVAYVQSTTVPDNYTLGHRRFETETFIIKIDTGTNHWLSAPAGEALVSITEAPTP